MKNRFSVILDWDDCLCQCNEYLLSIINEKYGKYYTMRHLTKWGPLGDPILDGRFSLMDGREFHERTPMYPGAKAFIYELKRMGAEVFIMTAVSAKQTGMRMERIMKEFPDFKPENVIFGSRKDMVNADFLLDDACQNVMSSNVKYPVLFRRPIDIRIAGLMAVNDYQGFLTLVRSIMYPQEKTMHDGPLVLVGPTGSGKTSISKKLTERDGFERVISYTTRQKREEEPEDAYVFISEDDFEEMERDGVFVEMTSYGHSRYGSSKKDIDFILDRKDIPVMVLDICGAVSVKQHYPNSTLVFIERDKESCFRALLERNLSIDETVNRLASFDGEMKNKQFCDITLKNNKEIWKTAEEICRYIFQ